MGWLSSVLLQGEALSLLEEDLAMFQGAKIVQLSMAIALWNVWNIVKVVGLCHVSVYACVNFSHKALVKYRHG